MAREQSLIFPTSTPSSRPRSFAGQSENNVLVQTNIIKNARQLSDETSNREGDTSQPHNQVEHSPLDWLNLPDSPDL